MPTPSFDKAGGGTWMSAGANIGPTASLAPPPVAGSAVNFYSVEQYSGMKSELTKYAFMAGAGGLVVGFLLAKFLK